MTYGARDIIAKLISGAPFPSKKTFNRVDNALDALAAAGYRILAPGALDKETLEAAAKVADTHVIALKNEDMSQEDWWAHAVANGRAKRIASAIRVLGGGEG